MSLSKCPVQEACIHYQISSNKPSNHDVRNKYVCSKYIKGCEMAVYVETQVMGLAVACKIKRKVK